MESHQMKESTYIHPAYLHTEEPKSSQPEAAVHVLSFNHSCCLHSLQGCVPAPWQTEAPVVAPPEMVVPFPYPLVIVVVILWDKDVVFFQQGCKVLTDLRPDIQERDHNAEHSQEAKGRLQGSNREMMHFFQPASPWINFCTSMGASGQVKPREGRPSRGQRHFTPRRRAQQQ